ncbi:TPA: four helix bundle protein [Stenotrophomonas maltophilia]|uniref:four helix bundle protein n=1 Tax=Stenotrophomonas maltophilia TaxID=40324 RepID=UPI0013DBBA3F|nr:four helix bundle protein [Stenotrophomonas maltophilia]HDS1633522.1 four helix bundle protein [Stenotrophomonas maltophilia]
MTSRFQPPPIIKAAEHMAVEIENAVRRFARYHRYQIGSDLRARSQLVFINANNAWRERAEQARWVAVLVRDIDALKQLLQIGKRVGAFASFRQFEMLIRLAEELGMQAGGWRRRLREVSHAQNAQADGVAQRGKKLSTRTALAGANS